MEEVSRQKERILSSMMVRGPSLPVQIARELGVSPLFAGAFLSELKAEDKLKLSNLRVGSSPLYFLQGQENLLEGFVKHLNNREREAFVLLQGAKVLDDAKQTPVVRVALRAIKDFAVPVKVRVNGESKLFWKYFSLDDSEVGRVISESVESEREVPIQKSEQAKETQKVKKPVQKESLEAKQKSSPEKKIPDIRKTEKEKLALKPGLGVKRKKEENEFGRSVRDYLAGKDVELLEILSDKKREFEGRVRIDTLFGKQEFYLVAKEKKSATENDLVMGWQKAHGLKLQALIMTTGELNKKAKEHLAGWKNLVKFEKLKF